MGNIVFNIAKGRVAELAALGAANDALIGVLLNTSGLEADATLQDYDTLAAILAAANDEAVFTNYARKTLTNVAVSTDDTDNAKRVDADDLQYVNAGGADNTPVSKLLICYDGDTTGGTDANIVPLVALDCVFTPDGNTVNVALHADGFFEAT